MKKSIKLIDYSSIVDGLPKRLPLINVVVFHCEEERDLDVFTMNESLLSQKLDSFVATGPRREFAEEWVDWYLIDRNMFYPTVAIDSDEELRNYLTAESSVSKGTRDTYIVLAINLTERQFLELQAYFMQ